MKSSDAWTATCTLESDSFRLEEKMTKTKGLLLIGLLVLSVTVGCTTLEKKNIEIVQHGYELFGQGDIPGFLAQLSEDIVWIIPGPDVMVGAGTYHGPEDVLLFFEKLGGAVEFQLFEPRDYIAQGDKVVVLGHSREMVKSTGRIAEFDWAGVYVIRDGKIVEYHVYEPTHFLVEAYDSD